MTEYGGNGPKAAWDVIGAAIDSAVLSGIVGDSAHTYGYHRGRNYCTDPGDYSCQQSDDQKGPGEAAVGLDVNLSDADMKTVTKRLIKAVDDDDDRLHCLREFYGTTNGYDVTGRDVRTGDWVTSDDSHLWHVHLSFYRRWADDENECKKVAAVFTGGATPDDEDDEDMKYTSSGYSKAQPLPAGKWSTLYVDDDNSQTFVTGPAHFQALSELNFTGLAKGSSVLVRFYQVDTKSGADSKRVLSYPPIEIIGTSGSTGGQAIQFGNLGAPAAGWTRRLKIEASPEAAGVAYQTSNARTYSY